MAINYFVRGLAPLAGLLALAGCGGDMNVNYTGDGVPLAEFDYSGAAPTGLVLTGPDTVTIEDGETFAINVAGSDEAVARMRFARDEGTLVIHRADGDWADSGTATVSVTLPSIDSMVMAGSGRIEALAVVADEMEVIITGSGNIVAGGSVERLSLNIVGSGDAEMERLQASQVDANIVGSGDAVVSSNGQVDANFVGSGDINVIGSARCEASSVGSGELVCGPA